MVTPARLTTCLLVLLVGQVRADPVDHDLYWKTQRQVTRLLIEHDLVELAKKLAAEKASPSDPEELLRRLQVFVRAGHGRDARGVIDALGDLGNEIPKNLQNDVAMFLLGREEWQLSARFIEVFPKTEAGWTYLLLRHWKESGKTPDEIDSWIEDRQAANLNYWIKVRIQFRAEFGTDGELIEKLADDIRAHPTEPARIQLYLDATSHRRESVEWLGKVFRPARALDAYEIGRRLIDHASKAAVKLLEQSLAMPLTDAEVDRARMMCQRVMSRAEGRIVVVAWFRQALVRAYQKVGEYQKAQKIMEKLIKEGRDGIMDPYLTQLAGRVQASSGRRVIENRIKKEEPKNKKLPEYWLARANYYAGRDKYRQAVQAYEKALALAPVRKKHRLKSIDRRHQVLFSYWRFLVSNQKLKKAASLLRRELKQVPIDSLTADRAVYLLVQLEREHKHPLDPSDPLLWSFLEKKHNWNHTEERLLWRLLELTPRNKRSKAYARAEKLTQGKHPTRAKVLGWILTRMDESARAIPLLKYAVARLEKKENLGSARFNLLEAYLDTKDWKSAENIFPLARLRLTPKEITSWHSKIAILAAKAGSKSDALRIWRECGNLDLADLRSLGELARAGIKEHLRRFYTDLAKRDPDSLVPPRALQLLQ